MSDLTPSSDQLIQNPRPDDEIDLKELFMVLWAGKWLIAVIAGLAATISIVFALSQPNIYRASALVAPAESGGAGLSGLMRQYGGLASLAGVSLPRGEEGSRAQLGIQLMKSRAFIRDFIERRDILPELMAVESWDAESGGIVFDAESYEVTSKTWLPDLEAHRSGKPSAQEAYKVFVALLRISQDNLTGYVTVSIDHQSPKVAAQWVTWLIEDVNATVKLQDVAEAERSIEYLKQQVANTSLADLQAMFFELVQSQTETVMLAEVRPEYVFKTIDPAISPEERISPNRALICLLGSMFGGLLGIMLVLLRHYSNDSRPR